MQPLLHTVRTSGRLLGSLLLSLLLVFAPGAARAINAITLTFENEELQTVIKKVAELTETTFLFNPEQVQGRITLLSPKKVSAEEGLQLLESALALHGYTLLRKADSVWIVPTGQTAQLETIIEVVPLNYAKAGEVAYTLSEIAPPGVQSVPYYPTNSLLISGHAEAVAKLIDVIRGRKKARED